MQPVVGTTTKCGKCVLKTHPTGPQRPQRRFTEVMSDMSHSRSSILPITLVLTEHPWNDQSIVPSGEYESAPSDEDLTSVDAV